MDKYKGIKHGQVNLFFNWYLCKSEERQKEIDYCLMMNRLVFDRVIIVNGRPTFKELFDLSKEYPNDINCFCNSDVYVTDLTKIREIKPNECYALTRNDMLGHKDESGSQDFWCFKGEVKEMFACFYMGQYGCDNRLAYEIQKAGYEISNPSLSINIVHVHSVDEKLVNGKVIRTKENTVKPPYLTLKPIKI